MRVSREDSRLRRMSKAKSKFEYWIYEIGGVETAARQIGVSEPTLYNWLNRKNQPTLISILRILKIAPNLTVRDIARGTLP